MFLLAAMNHSVCAPVIARRPTSWDINRKFREAKGVTLSICSTVSEFGMVEYRSAMRILDTIDAAFKKGLSDDVERRLGSLLLDDAVSTILEIDPIDPQSLLTEVSPPVSPPDGCIASVGSPPTTDGIQTQPQPRRAEDCLVQPILERPNDNRPTETSGQTTHISNDCHTSYSVVGPSRPSGRSRQKPKAKKTKRRSFIQSATEDSDMFDRQLSLDTVAEILQGNPDYDEMQTLRQFNVYRFKMRPKAPTAYVLSSLRVGKVLLNPLDLSRVLPVELLRRCQAKITALQRKHKHLPETNTAIKICGVGVFTASTLTLMRKWHTATEALNLVDKTMKWVKTVDVDVAVPPNFIITEDDDICKRITALRPLSFDTELLYVAGKGTLGCKAIQTILTKLFSSCSSITALDCTLFGQVENGVTTTHIDVIKSALCGICTGKILIPINCIGNHWCGIMIDMEAGKINYYDPMQSSYTKDVRALAERIASLLPMPNTERIRVIPYSTDMGIQMDTYNCGVYVLLAFEMFADPEASELQQITRKALAYLRYRYLVLCV